jgi:hypothetical protein
MRSAACRWWPSSSAYWSSAPSWGARPG